MKKLLLFVLVSILMQPAFAQIPVYEEPRHKVALQNEYIRLIDVNIPPHDTTLYHRHSTPSAIVFLSKSVTGAQVMGGEINAGGHVMPGYSVYADFASKPVSHRVWNEGDADYHVMDIEIFPRNNTVGCNAITDSSYKLAWEKKNVRVYNMQIAQGKKINIKGSSCPHLLILISGIVKMDEGKQIKPGRFLWYPSGSGFILENKDREDVECVLLELL